MPIPFILGAAAVVAAVGGVASGVSGASKMKEANDTIDEAKRRLEKNKRNYENKLKETNKNLDSLGECELEIVAGFKHFSEIMEKIQNKPDFKKLDINKFNVEKCSIEELKKASIGADILLGGLKGAAAGTAGGFAAAGATTSAMMALGTASTGTAIASLSGAAATNATLAALGGGAIAAGGGGIALGTTLLGASTLGVGLLVGGVIFNITGDKLSDKADEAWSEMLSIEKDINKIIDYLNDIDISASRYLRSLKNINSIYKRTFGIVERAVGLRHKVDYNKDLNNNEKTALNNSVLLVNILFQMCKVKFLIKDNDTFKVNKKEVDSVMSDANSAENYFN